MLAVLNRASTSMITSRGLSALSSHSPILVRPPRFCRGHSVARCSLPFASTFRPPRTFLARFWTRLRRSSSARYRGTSPSTVCASPKAFPPAAMVIPKLRAIHDLPSLGLPARIDSPSLRSPGTAHFGGGNSMRIRSARVTIVGGGSSRGGALFRSSR